MPLGNPSLPIPPIVSSHQKDLILSRFEKNMTLWQNKRQYLKLRKLKAFKSDSPTTSDISKSKNGQLLTYEIDMLIFCENDLKLSLFCFPYDKDPSCSFRYIT